MNIHTAHSLIIRDRMDWRKPHLRWIPERAYRFFSNNSKK